MPLPPFIHSLHRPFHQSLKATKWVCGFLDTRAKDVKSSNLNIEFYLYLINNLHREYGKISLEEYNGLPSKQAVDEITKHLSGLSKSDKIITIAKAVKTERDHAIERQIYSTYKAASYFVNLAKDKLKLIDKKNHLTIDGKELLSLRSGFFTYSPAEKIFFFKKIIEADFLLFTSLCFFLKLSKKYSFRDYVPLQFDFLDQYYGIRHFNFTTSSLGNYNTVRNHWISALNVLDTRLNIKPRYYKIIQRNERYKKWNEDLLIKLNEFEKRNFKDIRSTATNIAKLEKCYKQSIKKNFGDLGFVNLYTIKEQFKISHENFEILLNKYYEQEKGKKHIFFSNIVSSIDRRKRFNVRGVPVLKIKIK